MTFVCNQRHPGIKTDIGIAGYQRVVKESGISLSIAHNHQIGLQNSVGAESGIAGRLFDVDARDRLEPLPVLVNQRNGGDGNAADVGGETDNIVEVCLGWRV